MPDSKIPQDSITPESVFLNRRNFMRAGLVAGTALATSTAYRAFNPIIAKETSAPEPEPALALQTATDKLNTWQEITHYNNFYEFSTSKQAVAARAADFITTPWHVEVGGLVAKPQVFDMLDLLKLEQLELLWQGRYPRNAPLNFTKQFLMLA